MNGKLTWKKRFVSLFVLAFVGAVAVPALADDTDDPAKYDPANPCIGNYCPPGDEHPAACHKVCNVDAKGKTTACHQVCR
jgi:hypothetical protein